MSTTRDLRGSHSKKGAKISPEMSMRHKINILRRIEWLADKDDAGATDEKRVNLAKYC